MEELNDLVEKAQAAKRRSAYVNYVSANDILAIAEAFRALAQRAEAAEAKLAELENQELSCNHHWIRSEGRAASGWLCSKCGDYDGPAPAPDLAALVPDKWYFQLTFDIPNLENMTPYQAHGAAWEQCRTAILLKIEEAK